LGESSVPTLESIVWNNKAFRNKSDCKFHQMPEGFQPPPPVVITNRTTVNTYVAHQGFNFDNSESKSLFAKAPSSLLSYRKQVQACITGFREEVNFDFVLVYRSIQVASLPSTHGLGDASLSIDHNIKGIMRCTRGFQLVGLEICQPRIAAVL
jgi:hypothetical protein